MDNTRRIILGSTSKWRRQILAALGIPFVPMAADIDEKSIRHDDPSILTYLLAQAKANALLPGIAEPALLITADQVVVHDGEILEKPDNIHEAKRFLSGYGRCPAVSVTTVMVTDTAAGAARYGTDVACVYFRPFPLRVIDRIIARGEVMKSAGAFTLDDPDIEPFVRKVIGEKHSIDGLPVGLTLRLLAESGYAPE